jgi:acyl-CoA thioester hydrolase
MDNDHYGHVNNVAYYSFFDTAVNGFLIDAAGTDIRELPAIGIVAESSCRFISAVSFPDTIHAGLSIEKLGTRSVVYTIALFRNDDAEACAMGRFAHVYVDRTTRRPVEIPAAIRRALESLQHGPEGGE